MLKTIAIISALLLTGCSQTWKPVVDPRASKEPKEIIRDEMECERLIKKADSYKGKPVHERADFKFLGINFCWHHCERGAVPNNYNPLAKCLTNRGHSIINW
tara:strand:- start:9 stop:314 length:306 start_codon:yes stop_codon:yes gene_type:complete